MLTVWIICGRLERWGRDQGMARHHYDYAHRDDEKLTGAVPQRLPLHHIDTEGLLEGIPLDVVKTLRGITSRQLIVAGGIASQEEVDQLDALNVDAVVGMAIIRVA